MSPPPAFVSGSDQMSTASKYEKICDLNSGAFGSVQLCKHTVTGIKCAVKFIPRGDEITKYVEREILNHRQLVHPHIVHFQEVYLTPQYLAIAMEFVPGGDLYDYVADKGGLDEAQARAVFQQLITAVEYCHFMGVVNRDIKLENALIDNVTNPDEIVIKLCDFGFSKNEKHDSAPRSWVGTNTYLAPEVIMSSGESTYDGKMADVWCCGVMLYAMMEGDYPFERAEDDADGNNTRKLQRLIMRILKAEYQAPSKASDDCLDLLSKILVTDPNKRISIEGIKRHPWFCQDLSPSLARMNDECCSAAGAAPLEQGSELMSGQSPEAIKKLIIEAQSMGVDPEVDEDQRPSPSVEMDRLIAKELQQPWPPSSKPPPGCPSRPQRTTFTGCES